MVRIKSSHVFFVGACVLGGIRYAAADDTGDHNASADPCMTPAPTDASGPLPTWLSLIFGGILLCLSGIFSGLTLGLLGLDTMALKAVAEAGEEPERSYAQKIIPLREDGNLLLCTLLLGNVMVNVMIPILLADVTGGLLGFIFSTAFIVIFGEIVPQATCSKHALLIGSTSVPLVQFFKFVLFVLAKPIAMILDCTLGADAGQIYNKDELKQLLWQHLHEDKLEQAEFQILSRALDLQKTDVELVMTPEDKTYKLDVDIILDEEKLMEIWQTGHSRIPVIESMPDPEHMGDDIENFVGVLYTKDLITVRVEDKVTVRQILGFYNRGLPLKFDKATKLDKVLDIFRKGKTHIGFVTETTSKGGGDPEVDVVGIVTLEDVIEQLVGQEIVDEHDNYEDIGAQRRKRTGRVAAMPLGMLKQLRQRMAPDQAKMLAHFLSYSLPDPFAALSEEQLFQLLMDSGVRELRLPVKETPRHLDSTNNVWVYKKNKPMEVFTLILSGKLEAISSSEGFRTEYGPNQFIGARVLREGGTLRSDFDCRLIESPSKVVQISFQDVLAARKGTSADDIVLLDRDVEKRRNHSVTTNPISTLNRDQHNCTPQETFTPTTPELKESFS